MSTTRKWNAASSRWDLNNNKRPGEVSILFPAAKKLHEPELDTKFSPNEKTALLCYRCTPSCTSDVSSTATSHDCCSSDGNSPTTSFCGDCHSYFQQQQFRNSFPLCNLKCEFYLRNEESRALKDTHLDYIDKWYSSREQYIFDTVFTDPYTPPGGERKIAEVIMEPNLFPYEYPPDIEHWTLWSQQDMSRHEIVIWVGESLRKWFPHVVSWNYDSNGGDRPIEWFHVHIYLKGEDFFCYFSSEPSIWQQVIQGSRTLNRNLHWLFQQPLQDLQTIWTCQKHTRGMQADSILRNRPILLCTVRFSAHASEHCSTTPIECCYYWFSSCTLIPRASPPPRKLFLGGGLTALTTSFVSLPHALYTLTPFSDGLLLPSPCFQNTKDEGGTLFDKLVSSLQEEMKPIL